MSGRYEVRIKPRAQRELDAMPARDRTRLIGKIKELADDPRPKGVQKLAGIDNAYRVRVGDYRIVYEIHDRELVVVIIRVGHRREVYRQP